MKRILFIGFFLIELSQTPVFAQQNIDAYITDSANNAFILIAHSGNSVSTPIDIDFYPDQQSRPNELWVLNQGTYSSGGSTVIISNANQNNRTYNYVKDGNAWHFMALASAIAFGDSNWATSADILDANRSSGRYTGPTLWSGNHSVYGVIGNPVTSQYNGSHLDMIHQSPYGKGIAFEKENIYWVLDGYSGTLKRYDFSADHGPGQEYHGDGGVRVYSEFTFTKHATLPGHLVIDANKKYLYGCDPVGKRVFRLDITTGMNSGTLTKVNNETLAGGYLKYTGADIQNIISTGLTAPVGIDVYGNRLIITDNATDEIIIYDIQNNYTEVGRLKLKYAASPDPMGIKVGPDRKLYIADLLNQKVYRIENASVTALQEVNRMEYRQFVYPNPATDFLHIDQDLTIQNAEMIIINQLGEKITKAIGALQAPYDVSELSDGIYMIQLRVDNKIYFQKLIKL